MFYIWVSFDVSSLRVCVSPCDRMGFKKEKEEKIEAILIHSHSSRC